MKYLKAISKQLFGSHYQQIKKSLLFCLIIFLALYMAEIRIIIAPYILYFTSTLFSSGVMLQSLASSRNAENTMGLFLLPFENKLFVIEYIAAFSGYVLITKTALILAIFFALCPWTVSQIIAAILCSYNGCLIAAALYIFIIKKKFILALIWIAGIIASIFFVKSLLVFIGIVSISICIAVLYLLTIDAYLFYQPISAHNVTKYKSKRASVFAYLFRYLISNKSYLINTAGLCIIACFFPLLFKQFKDLNIMPLGFAILSLNTPMGILLSSDPDLNNAIRFLPHQATHFYKKYCIFLASINLLIYSFYLCSWQLQIGNIDILEIITAILFAIQSAIISVLLEWIYPIRNWKIQSDLWHHPRKYIVPLIMMLIAAFISMWPQTICFLSGILLIECCFFVFYARKV